MGLNGPTPAHAPSLVVGFLSSWRKEPHRGTGTARAVSGLAQGLRALGHRVVEVGPRSSRRPAPRWLARLVPLTLRRLHFNLALARRPPAEAFDLLVAFDLDGVALPRTGGPPVVVCLKGVAADEARFEPWSVRLRFRVLSFLEGRNARRAARVIVPSDYSAGEAILRYRVHPGRLAVVPEGIDLDAWARLRADPPAPPDPHPTVLTVGRQYRRKHTEALLEALPRVARAVPDVRLRVVGGGPRLGYLERRAATLGIADRVTFLGALPDDEAVRREYFRAHCFCLPTLQEAFGIVLLEAMAAGLPVVASRAASIPEVVPDGRVGLLVAPGDRDALAEALVRILTEPELREAMGRAATAVVRDFGLDRSARAFLGAVEPLLARRRQPRP